MTNPTVPGETNADLVRRVAECAGWQKVGACYVSHDHSDYVVDPGGLTADGHEVLLRELLKARHTLACIDGRFAYIKHTLLSKDDDPDLYRATLVAYCAMKESQQ